MIIDLQRGCRVSQHNREEAVTTQLVLAISKFGMSADAETIHVHSVYRPDVLFQLWGLRIIIEAKFADHPSAAEVVLNDARKRVAHGISHIAVAVVYPLALRTTSTAKILDVLADAKLKFRIVSETRESEVWSEGNLVNLMDALLRAQEALIHDDVVEKTAQALSARLSIVSALWVGHKGACDRLSDLLGIMKPRCESAEKAAARRETAAKVSALVLANALIFQEQLAATDGCVSPLRKLQEKEELISAILGLWKWAWTKINHVPIFQLGERILSELPSSPSSNSAVRMLLEESQSICAKQSALRHDLMGRIYHWLLHHAKYLGTYYTGVPGATLLLKLALGLDWSCDFSNPAELVDFKVADMACGTGTLLMASAQALSDVFIRQRAEHGLPLEPNDLQTLHRTLMENVLHGYDVLPSAVHLTASTLAMLAPEIAFRSMNLFVMPLGKDHGVPRLGSLDFLDKAEIATQMALDYSQLETVQTSVSGAKAVKATVPPLDLCIMNPPFVRSVYGNLLFGSLPDERDDLQSELSRRTKKLGVSATAGLGSVFVSLGDRHTKVGGRMAFVLPITLATGESWEATRNLIASKYHLEVVITSHDAERPSFSENTKLSELLFIARRLSDGENAGPTVYVNLWRNPRTIHEALDLATRIEFGMKAMGKKVGASHVLRSTPRPLGELTCLAAPLKEENWTGAIFAQSQLMNIYWILNTTSEVRLPGTDKHHKIDLCRLDQLGILGYDARDIFDAFSVDKTGVEWSLYPAFWDHDAKKVVTIAQAPNASLIARTQPLQGRNLKDAKAVWVKSGKMLLVSRLRTNTHRVVATGFDKRVLGNTWWGFDDSQLTEHQRKALLLWLNSTLSILSYFGRRAITEGAWMQMKKPAWASMPVLNVRKLEAVLVSALAHEYDALSILELKPIAQLHKDPNRKKIDKAICDVLGLPDLGAIRELLAREPGLSARNSVVVGIGDT